MVLGLPAADESEGFDRTHLNLPDNQLTVLKRVAAVNPNVVVVLANGSTVLFDQVTAHSKAVVEAWLGGQAAGGAIVDVLTGRVNPSGRMAETIPHRLEDNSSFINFPGDSQVVRYGEGLFIGYRGYDKSQQDVALPFGFGLSYTTFALSDLDVAARGSAADGTLAATVSVTVTNTGPVDGAEVVQVYVQDVESSATGARAQGVHQVLTCCRAITGGVDRAGPASLFLLGGAARPLGRRKPATSSSLSAPTPATCHWARPSRSRPRDLSTA